MNIAIVDDEASCRESLNKTILKIHSNIAISKFNSGKDFLQTDIYHYDMVFLDIEMDEMNGVIIANEIKEKKAKALIFFITSHSNYITSALKSTPFQYIMKPIDEKVFKEEFNRAITQIKKQKNEVKVTRNGKDTYIKIDKIECIEYSFRKLLFHCEDEQYVGVGKIKDFAVMLADYDFEQSHNSFLVNLAKVSRISGYEIVTKSGRTIPLSKKYYNNFRTQFREYVSGVVIC